MTPAPDFGMVNKEAGCAVVSDDPAICGLQLSGCCTVGVREA